MKKTGLYLLFGILAAFLAYACVYKMQTVHSTRMLCHEDPRMEWLRKEYHLTEDQYQKIKSFHSTFQPMCQAMCARIDQSQTHLDKLLKSNTSVTPEILEALKELEALHTECRRHTLVHLYDVSAAMSPEEGQRYFNKMLTHVIRGGILGVHEKTLSHCE